MQLLQLKSSLIGFMAGMPQAWEEILFSVEDLATVYLRPDGTVVRSSDPGSVLMPLPDVPASTGGTDDVRFADQSTLVPGSPEEIGVFFNSSPNWSTLASDCVGVRLPSGCFVDDTTLLCAAKGFISGTTDTSTSKALYARHTVDFAAQTITRGTVATFCGDAGVTKVENPVVCHNPVTGKTTLICSRDDRTASPLPGTSAVYAFESADGGLSWTGDGGAAFTPGGDISEGTDLTATVVDPAWSRFYMSPTAPAVDTDGTEYWPLWAVTSITYHMAVLKRSAAGAWSRIWTLTEASDTGQNENRVVGEHSVTILASGNLLIVGRPAAGWTGRYWWEITKAGTFVATGLYDGLMPVAIGCGVVSLDLGDGHERLLTMGPTSSLGTGLNDVGLRAAASYDGGEAFAAGPAFQSTYHTYRASQSGVALARPYVLPSRSGNSMLARSFDGRRALALIERAGPSNAGTTSDYLCVTARFLTMANAFRNAESWEYTP